jgi:zona occludens toxin
MITIITGTPGAGKTLYAVSKLLQKLLGQTFVGKDPATGQPVEQPRRIFTNIKGLTLDHTLIDGGNTGGLRNWHEWAQPGDVIVFDEVQEVWKPRANGSAVPPDIQALETHRHMGVDFILITQGINLTERNLSMLCGRHLHVRRVAAMPFAIVYEWDVASRSLLFSKAMSTEKWWYDRKAYKLYKSAELHTKIEKRMPSVIWVVLVAVIACGAAAPWLYNRYGERFGWIKPAPLALADKAGKSPENGLAAPSPAGAASGPAGKTAEKAPVFAGCVASRARCTCYDTDMAQVVKEQSYCEIQSLATRPPPIKLDWLRIPDQERHALEVALMSEPDMALVQVGRARAQARGAAQALPKAPAPLQNQSRSEAQARLQ